MGLHLRIENETSLPDGGPLEISVSGRRGIDIGRDPHLDWTLPDTTRHISGKHCEVRFVDGEYMLIDVSTNGTFVNGSDRRMNGPHRLKTGDRILIGNYIIAAEVKSAREAQAPASQPRFASDDFWSVEGGAPPAERSNVMERSPVRASQPDFLDWAVDVPSIEPDLQRFASSEARLEAQSRAVWVESSPTGAWATPTPTPTPDRPTAPVTGPVAEPDREASFAESPGRLPKADPFTLSPAAKPAAPPPAAAPVTIASAAASSGADLGAREALERLARGAGVPVEVLMRRETGDMMEEMGASMRVAIESMMRLLAARNSAKRSIRSGEYTTVGAQDNNPLKFAPSTEDAISILFGPPIRSYLTGSAAFGKGFDDIANHQVRVFAAMQQALKMLMEDVDPTIAERSATVEKGIGKLFGSQKSKLWDQYIYLWRAKVGSREDGVTGLFMEYFSKCYDKLGSSEGR